MQECATANVVAVPVLENKGQWPAGTSGNPEGRPRGVKTIQVLKNDLELAVRARLSRKKITRVINKMVALAIDGDVKAAKLIMDMTLSKQALQDAASERSPQITIVIENATLAAKVNEQPVKIIEGKYEQTN